MKKSPETKSRIGNADLARLIRKGKKIADLTPPQLEALKKKMESVPENQTKLNKKRKR
ncbi:MAG: hypothetical protein U9O78_01130 [Patescibacteria group bacterium]|nr:hypothetical protein [Patescibacteria group bacterium]